MYGISLYTTRAAEAPRLESILKLNSFEMMLLSADTDRFESKIAEWGQAGPDPERALEVDSSKS
jgi:hypothetical protein